MVVFCDTYDCLYEKNGQCTRDIMWVEDGVCTDFEAYIETKDYKNSYYEAIKTEKGIVAKRLCEIGKLVEYQGLTFYTKDKVVENDDDIWLTEQTTGLGVSLKRVKENFDMVLTVVQNAPKLETLPLARKDENGEWKIIESEETGE